MPEAVFEWSNKYFSYFIFNIFEILTFLFKFFVDFDVETLTSFSFNFSFYELIIFSGFSVLTRSIVSVIVLLLSNKTDNMEASVDFELDVWSYFKLLFLFLFKILNVSLLLSENVERFDIIFLCDFSFGEA